MGEFAVNYDTIQNALASIRRVVTRTPILTNQDLDQLVGGRVFVKAENLQRTGAFKFRGAMYRISSLNTDERKKGVVAFSSGNHALALAEAGAHLEVSIAVIVPKDIPAIKLSAIRARGAEVIFFDRSTDDRFEMVARIASDRGSIIVPPYDDRHIITGQGTLAAEVSEQLELELGVRHLDQAIVCCSGGGLAAGCITVLKERFPEIDFVTAEPDGFDDMARSLVSGKPETNKQRDGSVCDALLAPTPGSITFPILHAKGARGVSATDEDVMRAMQFVAASFKMVVEPGGAVALAALLSGAIDAKDKSTLVVVTGGNVDLDTYSRAMSWTPKRSD